MDKFNRINGWPSKNLNEGAIPHAVSPGPIQSTTVLRASTRGKHVSTMSPNSNGVYISAHLYIDE